MVSSIERGQCLPGLETFVALSQALHLNPLEILEHVDLRHLVSRARGSAADDRHRLAYLRKLFVRVREHRGLAVVKEYEAAMTESRKGPKEDAE